MTTQNATIGGDGESVSVEKAYNKPTNSPRCYAQIKALAKATGRNIPDMLAMACNNDPFYIMPSQENQAKWFAELWKQFAFPIGVHLRRIHYRLVSLPSGEIVIIIDGNPRHYQNTELCWQYLGSASKAARCLSLVEPDAFVDQRNPDPVLHRDYPERHDPRLRFDWEYLNDDPWDLPRIDAELADDLTWSLPDFDTTGYGAGAHDDPFHLELISEKSTMDDVVIPLCKELAINYAPATGFQSITGVIGLLKRLRQANKPGVVFYVSDFDPAGSFMPPSVARQIEFWRPVFAPGLDIVLLPIALTKEQVIHYGLPPIPIKESDKRQDNFLEKYGVQGATELDALEALHPGELRKIIRQAVNPYLDTNARSKPRWIEHKADEQVKNQWSAICRPYQWRLERLQEQASDIIESYQGELEQLRDAMNEELQPVKQALESLQLAINADADEFDPILPDRYESPIKLPDRFNGLFDSRRSYLEQIKFYNAGKLKAKRKKAKSGEEST